MTDLALHGLLLIDKPADMTSHDVVGRVRRIVGQKAVGHTGTLDPIATGLMILVLGEATKLSDYLIAAEKSYRVRVRLGISTDSLDRTGAVLAEQDCTFSNEQLSAAALALQGEFDWEVPLFSAAKVDGKKLYEYMRQGEAVARPIKRMSFWGAQVHEAGGRLLEASLHCSKGSFIRSWAARLGESLGVGGIVDELRRLSVGGWHVDNALTLEALEARAGQFGQDIIPMGQALPGLKSVMLGPKESKLIVNGQVPRDVSARLMFEQKTAIQTATPVFVKALDASGELLAILAAEAGQGLKIRRVFRTIP